MKCQSRSIFQSIFAIFFMVDLTVTRSESKPIFQNPQWVDWLHEQTTPPPALKYANLDVLGGIQDDSNPVPDLEQSWKGKRRVPATPDDTLPVFGSFGPANLINTPEFPRSSGIRGFFFASNQQPKVFGLTSTSKPFVPVTAVPAVTFADLLKRAKQREVPTTTTSTITTTTTTVSTTTTSWITSFARNRERSRFRTRSRLIQAARSKVESSSSGKRRMIFQRRRQNLTPTTFRPTVLISDLKTKRPVRLSTTSSTIVSITITTTIPTTTTTSTTTPVTTTASATTTTALTTTSTATTTTVVPTSTLGATVYTNLETASALLVTRNVTSTRVVTAPLSYDDEDDLQESTTAITSTEKDDYEETTFEYLEETTGEILKASESQVDTEALRSPRLTDSDEPWGQPQVDPKLIREGHYHEVNPGQYHEVNPGQYHEKNPGQYHEVNPGQYNEKHPGQYKDTLPTAPSHGSDLDVQVDVKTTNDTKIYNVQSRVDKFIIGEYGTISKSSGQTLQGVRYTALADDSSGVDPNLIYETLVKFFPMAAQNFESSRIKGPPETPRTTS